jgi:hypothetical protein
MAEQGEVKEVVATVKSLTPTNFLQAVANSVFVGSTSPQKGSGPHQPPRHQQTTHHDLHYKTNRRKAQIFEMVERKGFGERQHVITERRNSETREKGFALKLPIRGKAALIVGESKVGLVIDHAVSNKLT